MNNYSLPFFTIDRQRRMCGRNNQVYTYL